jgi:hypothetical protein
MNCFRVYSQSEKSIYKDSLFIATVLKQHNSYRSALGIQPLQWSSALASDAVIWAQNMATAGKSQHDPQLFGKKEGENIWWGTANAYSCDEMIDFWAGESKDFVYGIFPDCKTSHKAVVGHYTQLIWRNTSSVGCALVGNGKMDFLVCRYSPPGNITGQKPY